MNERDFVHTIKKVVTENSIQSVEEVINNPPGRSPAKDLISLSNWFKNLPNDEKDQARLLIKKSVDEAIFGFLCVLDGVRAIEKGQNKGKLLLYYEKDEEKVLINDIKRDLLHDIYNE